MISYVFYVLFYSLSYYVSLVILAVWGFVVCLQKSLVVAFLPKILFHVEQFAPLSLIIAFGSVP